MQKEVVEKWDDEFGGGDLRDEDKG